MNGFRAIALTLASIALIFSASCVYALDEKEASQVITKFLSSKNSKEGSADAVQHVIADLDGDGKLDLVLLWNVMGPTAASPKLTVFIDQGKTYRTVTTDLSGATEKLSVKGSTITVDTLALGPRDPLCCPTVKKQLQLRWQSGKLVGLR